MLNFFVTQSRLKDGLGCQKSSTYLQQYMSNFFVTQGCL